MINLTPAAPLSCLPATSGPSALDFRVRDGNGYFRRGTAAGARAP